MNSSELRQFLEQGATAPPRCGVGRLGEPAESKEGDLTFESYGDRDQPREPKEGKPTEICRGHSEGQIDRKRDHSNVEGTWRWPRRTRRTALGWSRPRRRGAHASVFNVWQSGSRPWIKILWRSTMLWSLGRRTSEPADQDGGIAGDGGPSIEGGQGGPPQDIVRGRGFFERVGAHAAVNLTDEEATGVGVQEANMSQNWDLQTSSKTLDVTLARHLDFQAEWLVPGDQTPLLFEIACRPDSLLTAKMRQLTKSDSSAERLWYWNGFDTTSSVGVRAVIKKIDQDKPQSVWISLERGPFSRMQNVNQRTAKQREDLKLKRANCMGQYIGGLLIYMHCVQNGYPVAWEWSETNDAWRLPMVQRVFQKFPPMFCVVKGCRVDLRDPKSKGLLQKGWKLATTHEMIAQRMELPCI